MIEHINFLNKRDFLESLADVLEKEQTNVIIYDNTGGLLNAWQDDLLNCSNLVFYRLDFEKKKFNNFVNNRILNGYNDFVLVYIIDRNFALTTNELTRAKNGGVYIRTLDIKRSYGFMEYESKQNGYKLETVPKELKAS